MRELSSLNKYLSKYKLRFSLGIVFVALANIFAVLPPVVVRSVLDQVYENISMYNMVSGSQMAAPFAKTIMNTVMIGGILLLAFALTRGIFMFFMRQTIIVMSRHIEFDQKNEIYRQYQRLDTSFFKSHSTGDLMSRISEDVSRVRMYTGPAIMYTLNLVVLSIMSIWGMLRVNVELTLYALFFLPLLAFSMIKINAVINKKSSQIQGQLGKLTSLAQETYSGIRVVKSYVQEQNIQDNFEKHSRNYRKSNLNLAKTEAMYTPLMGVFIGLSLILTVFIGGRMVVNNEISVGNIAEFIIYITMLTFPVSTLGWTSSIVQRAAASQKRINDFLKMNPSIENPEDAYEGTMKGAIHFEKVSFTYPHSSITALSDFSLSINPGEKVAIIGKTGSGKSTISHLLLRMYDVSSGKLTIDDIDVKKWNLQHLRNQISYVPQEVFLFSDTIASNVAFGTSEPNNQEVEHFAQVAQIDKEIRSLQNQYDTVVGERGVMLSGGQKQRVSIARALIKPHQILILDDSISAVDNNTEQAILNNLKTATADKTVIIITHRLFKNWNFDKIIVMENGKIIEAGTHETLLAKNGYYSDLYQYQILQND